MSCRGDAIKITVVYLFVFVVGMAIWGFVEAIVGRPFYLVVWYAVRGTFLWLRWLAFVPSLAMLWRIWHHATLMVHMRLEVEQIDPHADMPYSGRDPETRGRTYWDDYYSWDKPPPPSEPEPSRVPPVVVKQNDHKTILAGLPPVPEQNGPEKLKTLLHSVMGRAHNFSRADAMRGGLFSRAEWEALQSWAIEYGFHEKGSGELTPAGKRWAIQTIERLARDNGPPSPTPVRARDNGQ
jgi:hypothetical protein